LADRVQRRPGDGRRLQRGCRRRLGPEAIGDPFWSPARVASQVNADVLLGMQTDDRVLPQQQLADYVSRSPTAGTVSIPPGPDPYLHGTIGEEGRATLVAATQVFVDRAIAAHAVKTAAAASGCSGANTTLSRQGAAAFRTATACLVSRSRKMAGSNRLVAVASAGASRSTVSVYNAGVGCAFDRRAGWWAFRAGCPDFRAGCPCRASGRFAPCRVNGPATVGVSHPARPD